MTDQYASVRYVVDERQILLADPAGNLVELFQPAHRAS